MLAQQLLNVVKVCDLKHFSKLRKSSYHDKALDDDGIDDGIDDGDDGVGYNVVPRCYLVNTNAQFTILLFGVQFALTLMLGDKMIYYSHSGLDNNSTM